MARNGTVEKSRTEDVSVEPRAVCNETKSPGERERAGERTGVGHTKREIRVGVSNILTERLKELLGTWKEHTQCPVSELARMESLPVAGSQEWRKRPLERKTRPKKQPTKFVKSEGTRMEGRKDLDYAEREHQAKPGFKGKETPFRPGKKNAREKAGGVPQR